MSFLRRVGKLEQPAPVRLELPGGLLLLAEPVPTVPSLAFGVWVRSGSRHEEPAQMGAAHLVEHMVFKGTHRRTAFEIAKRLEALGGQIDAFTTKETTCYHARVFQGHRKQAVDLVCELISEVSFREKELEKERQIVIEEIHSYEDSPEEYVFDLGTEHIWAGHSLSHPILGRPETVKAMGPDDLRKFHATHYTRPNIIVTAAGNVDPEQLASEIDARLHVGTSPVPNGVKRLPRFRSTNHHVEKDVQQTSVCLMRRGPSSRARERHIHSVIHTILGSGVSSRLFQSIRESQGLAYTVYSYLEMLRDTGIFSIYMGVEPSEARRALSRVGREMRKLAEKGVKKWELESAKAQLLTQLFLSYESMFERMNRLAYDELYYGAHPTLEKMVREIDDIRAEEIAEAAAGFLDPSQYCLVTVGPRGQEALQLSDLTA